MNNIHKVAYVNYSISYSKNTNEYIHVDMNLADTYDTQNCKHMVT